MGGIIFKNSGEDTSGQQIILTQMLGLLSGVNLTLAAFNRSKKISGNLSVTDKLSQIRLNNAVTNLTLISYVMQRYYIGNTKRVKPAAVLAGVPLGTVDELSHALSDRVLKYRATGGVFLAHQDGGNESLRIICKAWGKDRYFFLILLDFIFSYGQSKVLDMFAGIDANDISGGTKSFFKGELRSEDVAGGLQIRNPWRKFDIRNTDEGRHEYHLTFPIVTKNRVYSSMYLETYDIVETVSNGMNLLTITLFLRKYRTPYPPQMVKVKTKRKGKKEPEITTWYRAEKSSEGTPVYKGKDSLRWIDSILDFGLSLIIMAHKYIMMHKYSAYTPEQMFILTFATQLDKSKSLTSGQHVGIYENEDGNLEVTETLEESMGIPHPVDGWGYP